MEEQKKTVSTDSDAQPQVTLLDKEPVAQAVEPTPVAVTETTKKSNRLYIVGAIVLVVVALLAVWMRLEREGRVDTSFFSSLQFSQSTSATVAVVNGEELVNQDLELSIEQLNQAAVAQGRNPEDEVIKNDIREAAIDMLVNTTLLQQSAASEGVVISDEEVFERISALTEQAGGSEVLESRMQEFGIDQDTFEDDIRTELTITTLLDDVLAEADLTVTEAEVVAVYEQAGGTQPDAPTLDEVRPQIEQQILQTKERAVVDEYIDSLRAVADIEIVS